MPDIVKRTVGQAIVIDGHATIRVLSVRGDRVRFQVEACAGIRICCAEIIEELNAAAQQALSALPPQDGHPLAGG